MRRSAHALLVGAMLSVLACGDNRGLGQVQPPDASAGGRDASPRLPDAAVLDAAVPATVDAAPDAQPADAAPAAADASGPPDLTVEGVTRNARFYRVRFCNRGQDAAGSFRVALSNLDGGSRFETPRAFSVPAAGSCTDSGGITCGLVGDEGCSASLSIEAEVDSGDDIDEANELNNTLTVAF